MASLLVDPNPSSSPRLIAMISHFVDPTKTTRACLSDLATGGTNPATAGTLNDLFTNGNGGGNLSLDNLIALGYRYFCFSRPFGQVTVPGTNGYTNGTIPFDYPDATARGYPASIDPLNQTQNETIFGGTSYTDDLISALNTAGRIGSIYGGYIYNGPPHASSAVTTGALDNFSAVARTLGLIPINDGESATGYLDYAPPTLMGTNLLGWWEADHGIYSTADTSAPIEDVIDDDNTALYHWDSMYGSASWSQATAGNRPAWRFNVLNGHPVIRFDGTTDRMALASPTGNLAAFTILMVIKANATDAIVLSNSASVRQMLRLNQSPGSISAYDGTNNPVSNGSAIVNGTWYILRARFGDNGTNISFFVNGTEVSSYVTAQTYNGNTTLNTLGCLGTDGSTKFNSDIAAIAIMDDDCTNNQVQLIEAYWAAKYGITVSGTPSLPHKAYSARMSATHGVKCLRESWGYRSISSLTAWDAVGGGVTGSRTELDTAIASPSTYYTKASISGRGSVIIPHNGPTVAERTAAAISAMSLGYDAFVDCDGYTSTEAANQLAGAAAVANGGFAFPFRGRRPIGVRAR